MFEEFVQEQVTEQLKEIESKAMATQTAALQVGICSSLLHGVVIGFAV